MSCVILKCDRPVQEGVTVTLTDNGVESENEVCALHHSMFRNLPKTVDTVTSTSIGGVKVGSQPASGGGSVTPSVAGFSPPLGTNIAALDEITVVGEGFGFLQTLEFRYDDGTTVLGEANEFTSFTDGGMIFNNPLKGQDHTAQGVDIWLVFEDSELKVNTNYACDAA